MTSLPQALSQFLDDEGLGVYRVPGSVFAADEWAIVLEGMAPTPDKVICVTQYEGIEADSSLPWDEPRVQIRVRGNRDSMTSRDRAQLIYDLLNGLGPQTLSTVHLQLVIGLGSGPSALGQDQNMRFEHVVNFEVTMFNPNRRDASGYY